MLECSRHFRISYPHGANCDRIGQRNPAQVLQPLHSTSSQSSPPFRHCAIVGDTCAGSPQRSILIDLLIDLPAAWNQPHHMVLESLVLCAWRR